jgi:NADPH:quinone reductase-like Zn-dependent oxidoreductase
VLDLLQLKKGETLLLHGGAGVVGSMGVQLALLRGAAVVATASAQNQDMLKALGAIPVTYGEGLVGRVRALNKRIDAVFDAAGKGALPDSIELRGDKSRIITIADPAAFKLGIPFSTGRAEMRNTDVLNTMADLASRKKITVEVAETVPLAQAAQAHAHLEKSHKAGKIVLVA